MTGGVDHYWKANIEFVASTSDSSSILIRQLKRKTSESCQKVFHKLIRVATVRRTAL